MPLGTKPLEKVVGTSSRSGWYTAGAGELQEELDFRHYNLSAAGTHQQVASRDFGRPGTVLGTRDPVGNGRDSLSSWGLRLFLDSICGREGPSGRMKPSIVAEY